MRRVILETPYAGNVELNLRYLRAAMHDSLVNHGEAPFASHGLYTQPGVLRDEIHEERLAGIHAGFAWRKMAEATVVYTDLGISKGMQYGIADAERLRSEYMPGDPPGAPHVIEYRTLGGTWAGLDDNYPGGIGGFQSARATALWGAK